MQILNLLTAARRASLLWDIPSAFRWVCKVSICNCCSPVADE